MFGRSVHTEAISHRALINTFLISNNDFQLKSDFISNISGLKYFANQQLSLLGAIFTRMRSPVNEIIPANCAVSQSSS